MIYSHWYKRLFVINELEKIIQKFPNELSMVYITDNPNLTWEITQKYSLLKRPKFSLIIFSRNPNITSEMVSANRGLSWDVGNIHRNPNIILELLLNPSFPSDCLYKQDLDGKIYHYYKPLQDFWKKWKLNFLNFSLYNFTESILAYLPFEKIEPIFLEIQDSISLTKNTEIPVKFLIRNMKTSFCEYSAITFEDLLNEIEEKNKPMISGMLLSLNPNITPTIVKNNPHIPFVKHFLCSNPNFPVRFQQELAMDDASSYNGHTCFNPNLTLKMIQKNITLVCWDSISSNSFWYELPLKMGV